MGGFYRRNVSGSRAMMHHEQIRSLWQSLNDFRLKLAQPVGTEIPPLRMWLERINGLFSQVDFHHLGAVPQAMLVAMAAPIQQSAVAITEYVAGSIDPELAARSSTRPPEQRVRNA